MFALEIIFSDQPADAETIFVKRQRVLIGSSQSAHVEIIDMQELNYDLQLTRDFSRRFRVKPVPKAQNLTLPAFIDGVYEGHAFFDLDKLKLSITALDSDLLLKESEPPDRAGVRIMRLSSATPSPAFPALVVLGKNQTAISFAPDTPVYVGSAKSCALRIEGDEVSPKHARIGYESGNFWVEDIGSNQGTFVKESQISGRVNIASGTPINLGKSVSIVGVDSEFQLEQVTHYTGQKELQPMETAEKYPILMSVSEVARPARLVIPINATINVGRDPSSDIWLGAPHVSRHHCSFTLRKNGYVSVSDYSKNGTAYDEGVLKSGDLIQLIDKGHVFDFGGGITLALCFNEEQERSFIASAGDPATFVEIQKTGEGSVYDNKTSLSKNLAMQSAVYSRSLQVGHDSIGLFRKFSIFYQRLSPRSKLVLCITCAAVITILIVMFNLVVRLNV